MLALHDGVISAAIFVAQVSLVVLAAQQARCEVEAHFQPRQFIKHLLANAQVNVVSFRSICQ